MLHSLLSLVFPQVLWKMSDEKIYLTFDDGPDDEITPRLLELLKVSNLRATFFLIGQKAAEHPTLVEKISADGHTVGNHSFTHANMWRMTAAQITGELQRTDNVIFDITGRWPTLFRPPFGRFTRQVLEVVKYTFHRVVLWNASSKDFKMSSSREAIYNKVRKQATPGNIILMHDGHANSLNTLNALELFLQEPESKKLSFAAIPE